MSRQPAINIIILSGKTAITTALTSARLTMLAEHYQLPLGELARLTASEPNATGYRTIPNPLFLLTHRPAHLIQKL